MATGAKLNNRRYIIKQKLNNGSEGTIYVVQDVKDNNIL
jgi:hypothetical protein